MSGVFAGTAIGGALGLGATGTAIAGAIGGVGGSLITSNQEKKAIQGATNAQIEAGEKAQNRILKLLSPYMEAGELSLAETMGITGLKGAEAQEKSLEQIAQSPEFELLTGQAEEGLLAAQSATGSLRGGDTKRALAELRPSILNSLISQKLNRLNNLTSIGQASAAGTAVNTGNIDLNMGQSRGQGMLERAAVNKQLYGDISEQFGNFAGVIQGGF